MRAITLSTVALALVCGSVLAESGAAEPHSAVELRYRGTFSKASRDAEATGEPVKRFDLYCLSTPHADGGRDVAYVLDEQGAGGWPWPARFGTLAADAGLHPGKNRMRLLHDHGGTAYPLVLPFPYFEFASHLAEGARWEAHRPAELPSQNDTAPWKYRVSARTKIGARDCWRVDVSHNFGPQESLWIDVSQPLLVKAERRIVIGRGEVHLLKMELDSVTPLTGDALARVRRPLDSLLKLQRDLKRSDDDQSAELSDIQLKLVADQVKSLEQQAESTPLEGLVAAIVRDVNSQSRRTGDVESLGRRMVGKPAPPIRLKSLDGEAIPAAELAGKIVLLHFWSYQGDPFPPEPYGQIGFLDHLYHRRKKLGVQVYGVAIDSRLSEAAQAPAALRSIRKLQSFMNLTYPVVLDNGTLERLGDPERVGAKLPLWVLIDGKGTVVQYKVGNYVIKADEGLSQLDQAILALIKQQRTTKAN
ncbi:MAG TPA: TlpA disulfide reductase family protein [Planctomycetaceae bacterium]|nr:TlpA disulfide reductase family protein [Planctomycetaceae bacterium]